MGGGEGWGQGYSVAEERAEVWGTEWVWREG